MKKILTLLAMAVLAISATAQDQEKVLFDPDVSVAYGNGATLTSENTTLVLGNDRTTKNYDHKNTSAKAYCAELFGQIVMEENSNTGEMEEKTRVSYVVGNQNPKDGELNGDTSTGNGYKPSDLNLPQSGTYYMITPKKNGHIIAWAVLNPGKNYYVAKSDGSALPTTDIVFKADGDEATDVVFKEDYTLGLETKVNGTIEFDVEANETYYVFCTGSKLSFGGYVFTPKGGGDEPSGIFGDLNNDGYVNISDVTVLINIILGLGN